MTITVDELERSVKSDNARRQVVQQAQNCRNAFANLSNAMAALHASEPSEHICSFGLSTSEYPAEVALDAATKL